jgi:hypothetical protein
VLFDASGQLAGVLLRGYRELFQQLGDRLALEVRLVEQLESTLTGATPAAQAEQG